MKVAQKTAKITSLPPPSWLINVSPEDLRNEKPVGIKEICKELDNMSRVTVVALIKNEGLPGKKLGGKWEFYLTLVRAWRANRQLQ